MIYLTLCGVVRRNPSRFYGLIIKQYVLAEEPQFNLKYRTEWRERFLKQYHVEISPKEVII